MKLTEQCLTCGEYIVDIDINFLTGTADDDDGIVSDDSLQNNDKISSPPDPGTI